MKKCGHLISAVQLEVHKKRKHILHSISAGPNTALSTSHNVTIKSHHINTVSSMKKKSLIKELIMA
jgi:hypothetical protein